MSHLVALAAGDSMKLRAILTFVVAAALSALVWALSPTLTGLAEPWDAGGPYYILALAIVGTISGGVFPKPLWAHYLGAVVGQAGYEVCFLSIGPLFILGLLFVAGYSVVFLAAAAVAAIVRVRYLGRPNAA